MAESDRERWDARYAGEPPATPAPPAALQGREHLLPPPGRALDVACGRGAVAVWLACRGYPVDAVDGSGAAVRAGAALAHGRGVGERVRWWHHDLDAGLPATGRHDVVVCQRFRDPRLYPELMDRLAPGGLLVVTVLSQVGAGPGRWRAPAGELLAAFTGLEVLVHREADGEASIVARAQGGSGG